MRYFPFFAVLSVAIVSLLVYRDHMPKRPAFHCSPNVSTWEDEVAAQEKRLIKSAIRHSQDHGVITF